MNLDKLIKETPSDQRTPISNALHDRFMALPHDQPMQAEDLASDAIEEVQRLELSLSDERKWREVFPANTPDEAKEMRADLERQLVASGSYAEKLQRSATAFLARAVHCRTAADFNSLMDSDELFDLRGSLSKNTTPSVEDMLIERDHAMADDAIAAIESGNGVGNPLDIEAMVDRFVAWKLPQDFGPDAGISFTPPTHPNSWPTGTNLLTANQARAMFLHVLGWCRYGECRDRSQCWEPCGELGKSEAHARAVPDSLPSQVNSGGE